MASDSVRDEVWRLLMHKEVGIIGISGVGGIGKTRLLKQIYNKLANSYHDFDILIWVTVSGTFSGQKIVDDIWRRIGIIDREWVEKRFEEKAEAIHGVLCEKKFVLFLDDLWQSFELSDIGVPKQQNESKVLLTSRYASVCSAAGAQETINIEALDKDQAWEMFKKMIGENILSDPQIHRRALLVAQECEGLPIWIRTVARAMACKTTCHQWEDALKQLRPRRTEESNPWLRVRFLLDFCLDSFPSDALISCFLYYSLFPEDFTILKNDLIDFWICEHLLNPDVDSEEDVLSLGYNTIDALIGACFLDEEDNDRVKLQDLIRDYGLSVALHWLQFEHALLIEAKDYKSMETVGWISSMVTSIRNPANVPFDLSNFLLNHNPFIMIKGEFSQFMYALTVLDLSNSGVELVPNGIAKLVSLQCLNLSHTWIEYLPVELKMLTKLSCLNLEHNNQLRVIPGQVIQGLSSLQVLKIFRSGFSVEDVEGNILSVRNMDIDPLLCLEHLKVLSITITCASALQNFFSSPKLLSCTQSLSMEVFWGSTSLDISPLVTMKNLLKLEIHQAEDLQDLTMDHGSLHHPKLLKERCLEKLQEVTVEKCSSLADLTWIIVAPNLRTLRVKSCQQLKEIISIRQSGKILNGGENWEPFERLEILELESLPELKSIYWKSLPLGCLKKIKIIDCSLLKKLPLNADSTDKEGVVIEAEEEWWKDVEWEDDATRITFLPCSKPLLD